jgi:hypothetical protein
MVGSPSYFVCAAALGRSSRPATQALFGAAIAVAYVCAAPSRSAAEESHDPLPEQIVNELFLGQAVTTQARHELQVTLGPSWRHHNKEDEITAPLEVELGITDRFQVGVELPAVFAPGEGGDVTAGLGSAELEVFHNAIYDQPRQVALSLGFGVSLPASTEELDEQTVALEPLLVFYKRLGHVHLNATFSAEVPLPLTEDGEGARLGALGALSAFIQLGKVVPTLEVSGEYGEEPELLVAPGFLWHPVSEAELGAAFALGLRDGSRTYSALATATWEFDLGEEEERGGDEERGAKR